MGIIWKNFLLPVKYQSYMTFPGLHETVNEHIDPKAFMCSYAFFNDAVTLTIKHGVDTLSTKLDLSNTIKHIVIGSKDWPVLGASWDLQLYDGAIVYLYCIDLFPLDCTAPQTCSTSIIMAFCMPCMWDALKFCCITWVVTSLLALQTSQCTPTILTPWLLQARSLALLSTPRR